MKGVGTITDIKKYKGSFFFITGDDGVIYFARRDNLAGGKKYWKYCWMGNRASFDIEDNGGEHLEAVNINPVEETDPRAKEKAAKKREIAEQREVKQQIKEKNIARQKELKRRADMRKEDFAKHLKYVIQERVNNAWVNVEPLKIFDDLELAKKRKAELNEDIPVGQKVQFRVKKYLVYKVYGKYVFKDLKDRR